MGEPPPADPPYAVIVAVSDLAVLDDPQRELLRDLVTDHPELGGDVAVYWLRDDDVASPYPVVAPASSKLHAGDHVVSKAWSAVRQEICLEEVGGDWSFVELKASGSLVRVP